MAAGRCSMLLFHLSASVILMTACMLGTYYETSTRNLYIIIHGFVLIIYNNTVVETNLWRIQLYKCRSVLPF